MQPIELPDHTTVWAFSPFEARLIHREIVIDRSYERHGITVPEGGVVFDVGANIGLYALHLARTVPGVRVRSYEPVARTFRALEKNLAGQAPAITAIRAGLGAAPGTAVFEVDRFSTITSSMTPTALSEASDRSAPPWRWADAALADFERIQPSAIARWARRGLSTKMTRPLFVFGVAGLAAALDFRKRLFLRREPCEIRTLSAEMTSAGFDQIDLVKIDVEGGEQDVLKGIADADWPRIRQFVIEVHDVAGRRARMAAQLEQHGFTITHDREAFELHRLMNISTIYAVRA